MNRLLPFAAVIFLVCPTLALAQVPKANPAIAALALTPDGKAVVSGSQAGVIVRNLADGSERSLGSKLDYVYSLAFAPDGAFLAAAGGSPAEAGLVEVYSWPEGKLVSRLEGTSDDRHEDVVHAVAWLPDGKRLATASADRTARIWERSGKCVHTLKGHSGPVLAAAVTPDGKWLCTGSGDQTIRVWNTTNGELVRGLNNHLGAVHGLAFRPTQPDEKGPYLASCSEDGTVRIWQPTMGRMVRFIKHPGPIFAVGWNRDGARLYSAGKDGVLRQIDGDGDELLKEHKLAAGRVTSLVVRPRDEQVIVGHASGSVVAVGKE